MPLLHLIRVALNNVDVDLRAVLLANIVITGGATLMPGFIERLQNELHAGAPGVCFLIILFFFVVIQEKHPTNHPSLSLTPQNKIGQDQDSCPWVQYGTQVWALDRGVHPLLPRHLSPALGLEAAVRGNGHVRREKVALECQCVCLFFCCSFNAIFFL